MSLGLQSPITAGSVAIQQGRAPAPPFRVWMNDPWCRTPWYTGSLARALEKNGHRVRFASPSYHLEPDYFHTQGLRPSPGVMNLAVRCGTISKRLLAPARLLEYGVNAVALGAIALADPPEILHQQQCTLLERGWKPEIAFLRWCRGRGVAVVYTVHNLLPHQERPFHAALFQDLYRFADALICHDTQSAAEINRRFGIEERRIHVIPHGPLFAEDLGLAAASCRAHLGLAPDRQIYLALGVLARYKGLDLLLESWSQLLRRERGSHRPILVIAGEGPESEKLHLRQRAQALGIDPQTVRLDLGYVPASRLPVYLQAADVLLYPYQSITTSGALLTGLNYCKPIVASDLPAFRSYLYPGVNALVVPPGDGAALTGALAELRDRTVQGRLEAGSRNNRGLVVQWDEIAARTAEVYRVCANDPR